MVKRQVYVLLRSSPSTLRWHKWPWPCDGREALPLKMSNWPISCMIFLWHVTEQSCTDNRISILNIGIHNFSHNTWRSSWQLSGRYFVRLDRQETSSGNGGCHFYWRRYRSSCVPWGLEYGVSFMYLLLCLRSHCTCYFRSVVDFWSV